MTSADWNTVLNLVTNGIKVTDKVFTGVSLSANGFFTATGGTVAAMTTGNNISSTFKIGVRYVQNFKAGDKRLIQNFRGGSTYNNPFYGTPYNIKDSLQQSTTGVYVLGSKLVGQYEVYIAGSYEENALMLAEAEEGRKAGRTDTEGEGRRSDHVAALQAARVEPVAQKQRPCG